MHRVEGVLQQKTVFEFAKLGKGGIARGLCGCDCLDIVVHSN